MVFHWSLSDSKPAQISRALLKILAVFNNAVVSMVSTRPPTFKSCRAFNNPSVTVPKAPITIGTIVTFMFHSFFNSLSRWRYLSFFSHSLSFILWSAGTAKSTILQIRVLLVLSSYYLSIQLFVMIFWLLYFRPKTFSFFGVRLKVRFCVMPSQLMVEFSFVVLECTVLFILFYPLSISL